MAPTRTRLRPALMLGAAAVALTACQDMDFDLRNNGANTSAAAVGARSAPRPQADDRGIISYPGYQVAVARRGDTVDSVAARLGLPADELAAYNGIPQGVTLRPGEIVALPRRVAEPSPATGSVTTGPIQPPETIDITAIASGAIDRASGQTTVVTEPETGTKVAVGEQPVRHKVRRGETAYSISRLYGVSVSALADWNGLGPDLSVREGQYLLIPVATGSPEPVTGDPTPPGTQSPVPTPPSAAEPLPEDEPPAASAPDTPLPSPNLAKDKTTSSARLQMPLTGPIIRAYDRKKNEGIDIAADAGATVRAAADGEVAAITRDTDQVPILVLRHDGDLLTVYANLDGISVKKGDKVKRGQSIAKVRAGTPSFLHFEVREGFESVDPAPYLQ